MSSAAEQFPNPEAVANAPVEQASRESLEQAFSLFNQMSTQLTACLLYTSPSPRDS